MEKRSLIFISAILFAIMLSFVSAAETTIKVKTQPNHYVSIFVLDPSTTYSLIESFHRQTLSDGEAIVTANPSTSKIKVLVVVKKEKTDKTNAASETFADLNTGGQLEFEVYPDGYEPPKVENKTVEAQVNDTVEKANETESTSLSESNQSNSDAITGNAILGDFGAKNIIWIIGITVVVASFIAFIFIKRGKMVEKTGSKDKGAPAKKQNSKPSSPPPEMPLKNNQQALDSSDDIKNVQDSIANAERKIREAQAELNAVRNKERISILEKQIAREQAELTRLKGPQDL